MAIKYNMEFYTHITIPKTPFTPTLFIVDSFQVIKTDMGTI